MFPSRKMIKNQHENSGDSPDRALARGHNNGYGAAKATSLTVTRSRDGVKLYGQLFRYHEVIEACHWAYPMPLEDNGQAMVIKRDEEWFDTVILRSFVELYRVTNDTRHFHSFRSSLRQTCREKTPQ